MREFSHSPYGDPYELDSAPRKQLESYLLGPSHVSLSEITLGPYGFYALEVGQDVQLGVPSLSEYDLGRADQLLGLFKNLLWRQETHGSFERALGYQMVPSSEPGASATITLPTPNVLNAASDRMVGAIYGEKSPMVFMQTPGDHTTQEERIASLARGEVLISGPENLDEFCRDNTVFIKAMMRLNPETFKILTSQASRLSAWYEQAGFSNSPYHDTSAARASIEIFMDRLDRLSNDLAGLPLSGLGQKELLKTDMSDLLRSSGVLLPKIKAVKQGRRLFDYQAKLAMAAAKLVG